MNLKYLCAVLLLACGISQLQATKKPKKDNGQCPPKLRDTREMNARDRKRQAAENPSDPFGLSYRIKK